MPRGIPRNPKPCPHCGEAHHNLAYCKDGTMVAKKAPPYAKGENGHTRAKKSAPAEPEAPAVAVSSAPEPPAATRTEAPAVTVTVSSATDDLRAVISALPEGSQQRKSMQLLLDREEARAKHDHDEAEYQRLAGPDAHLPLPVILRDPSDDKGRKLNSELDRLLAKEGISDKRDRSMPDVKRGLQPEAQALHDTLASVNDTREMTERQRQMAASVPEHLNGSTRWQCNECHHGFNSGSLEQVREKARQEPSWRFVCPDCQSSHIQLVQLTAVA